MIIEYIVQFIILVLGIASTWYFAKFYYLKSKSTKGLSITLQNSTNTISVQNDVRSDLEIKYKNEIVTQLIQLQFVIKNSGNTPISNIKNPLSFKTPTNYNLVSIEIPHIHPEGRDVKYLKRDDRIEYRFDILNSGEYFIVNKMFSISANANPELVRYYQFTISAEDLPPIYKIANSGIIDNIELKLIKPLKQIKGILLVVMRALLMFMNFGGILMIILLTKISIESPNLNLLNPIQFFSNFSLWSIAIITGWILSVVLLVSTIGLLIEGWRKKVFKTKTMEDELENLPENILK